MSRALKLAIAAAVATVLLALAAVFGFRAAVEEARRRVVAALGPGARIAALRVTTRTVEVDGLVIPGGPGWPAADALRADRVVIQPSLRSLATSRFEISSIAVKDGYLSALRTRDGRVRILPSLLEESGEAGGEKAHPAAAARPVRSVSIDQLSIDGGRAELYDASVAQPPWPLRLDAIHATVRDVEPPALASRMAFELEATLQGPKRNGKLGLRGWLDGATRDLDLDAKLRGADLLVFEPYLVKGAGARLAGGALDLGLDATVRSNRLHAPGTLSIEDLEFAGGGDAAARVLGIPRELLAKSLAQHGGRIELSFTLEGDLDDPRFSLNEVFGTRIAVALADALGLSVRGLVEGVGGLGGESLEGVDKAARGLGSALKGLLPKRPSN
jgi:hypothetical protein